MPKNLWTRFKSMPLCHRSLVACKGHWFHCKHIRHARCKISAHTHTHTHARTCNYAEFPSRMLSANGEHVAICCEPANAGPAALRTSSWARQLEHHLLHHQMRQHACCGSLGMAYSACSDFTISTACAKLRSRVRPQFAPSPMCP